MLPEALLPWARSFPPYVFLTTGNVELRLIVAAFMVAVGSVMMSAGSEFWKFWGCWTTLRGFVLLGFGAFFSVVAAAVTIFAFYQNYSPTTTFQYVIALGIGCVLVTAAVVLMFPESDVNSVLDMEEATIPYDYVDRQIIGPKANPRAKKLFHEKLWLVALISVLLLGGVSLLISLAINFWAGPFTTLPM